MSLHVAVVTPAPAPGDQKVAAAPAHAYGTKVFDEEMKDADALVTGVISANAGTSREN